MQAQILQGEKVENRSEMCIKMWKTSEKSLKNGWYYVENSVDAVDSTQFGHKFISNFFYSFHKVIDRQRKAINTIKDSE